ncbi:DUF5057 domain-containing protein [Mobilitalea sibirica]|uniref:DUF5057 domain-containing protein n=1 Tax=Mobilitalea sibirica TaxID=1462919 RepID=A0A8J7KV59_9FIRM|nr:DUF5057 domain-containing protein [Mobilitalea sibirica]MBH1939790.1 DUF5057 domain-containing protein [Mobilitalea sibirica]
MKNKIKGILLIGIIMTISFFMPSFLDNSYNIQAADEAEWSEGDDGTGEFNGFTVVEIVPYKGMGEIGYLIGGQEPIDQELMTMNSASGQLNFLGGAITVYPSYEESAMPASGNPETGWFRARTYVTQNGYFEYVNGSGPELYRLNTNQTIYEKVDDGTGTHKAVLPSNITLANVYENVYNPLNYKNVQAYFIHQDDTEIPLYSTSIRYKPYSVTENVNHTGNYDYNPDTQRFILNKGAGKYDVLFTSSGSGSYFMAADYQIVDDNSGDYSYANINYILQSGGNYRVNTNGMTFTYEQYWNGYYRWVQDDTALSKPTNFFEEDGRIWVKGQRIYQPYQYTYNVQLVNNEWFKRHSLGIQANYAQDYPVRVITITPNELNLPENQHYIDEANLFYINANYNHNWAYIWLYENYSHEGQSLPYNQKYSDNQNSMVDNLNFAVNDLSWTSVDKIFRRIAGIGSYKASLIIDSTFYSQAINGSGEYDSLLRRNINVGYGGSDNGTSCNVAKLYIMVYQRNMIDFYNSFMNPDTTSTANRITNRTVNTNVNRTGSTGSFRRPNSSYSAGSNAALYWNENTFLPYGLNENGEMVAFTDLYANGIYNANMLATTTDLTDNVLTLNGQDIFTSKFLEPINLPDDSRDDASDHLSSLNPDGTPVTSFRLTDIVNVITNNGTGFEEVGGISYPDGSDVEGVEEETSDDTVDNPADDGTDGSNLRTYKRVLNIQPTADFTASEEAIRTILSEHNVQIVNMTSIQFNSSIEDINARYDMIYMGSGAGRYNYDRYGRVIYNDGGLDPYIYYNDGDTIAILNDLSNVWNVTTERFQGNDLTSQKVEELSEFLTAGYPMVLDANLYQRTNIRTNTDIYAFITQYRNNSSYPNFLNTADFYSTNTSIKRTFNNRLSYALNIIRPRISLIEPILAEDTDESYIYVDPNTDLLSIKFKILPKNANISPNTYNAYLYVDKNMDGVFDEATEQLSVVSGDGSLWEGLRESNSRVYSYQYDMSDLNGVYQWKLIVTRQNNSEIRGAVTGYATNTNKEDLYILHIRDNNSTYNLETKMNDTSSLMNQYGGEGTLNDYNLHIESMTVAEYVTYANDPNKPAYNSGDLSGTSRLLPYHLVILDNPNTSIPSNNVALTNLKDEIANGLPVIFTKNVLGYDRQASYYSGTQTSFLSSRTYNYLNRRNSNNYWLWEWLDNQLYIYRNMIGDNSSNLERDNAYTTNYLTKTNEGSITRYPYQINKAIRIATNHYSNDVTVDFNKSQNRMLIGWYSLSDSRSPVVKEIFGLGGTNSELYHGTYSSSPNDVKNNYYLFSNGLCFYSGINLAASDVAGNEEEIKLFINTIITAYKASDRVISSPPVITITNPVPVVEGTNKVITIRPTDLAEEEFILTFEIAESSSVMELDLTFDTGFVSDWHQIVYEVDVSGTLGDPIDIINNKVNNGTYAVKIPATQLDGENTLTIEVTNLQSNNASCEVILKYISPPVVTIEDPVPISNSSAQYIYVDIDFSEDDISLEGMQEVIFKVEKDIAMPAVNISITAEGENLMDGGADDVTVNKLVDGIEQPLILPTDSGLYKLYLPLTLMRDKNSREITITAEDITYGYNGSATVILLRRSLFPLD